MDLQGAMTPTVMLSLRSLLRAARLAAESSEIADYLQSALMMDCRGGAFWRCPWPSGEQWRGSEVLERVTKMTTMVHQAPGNRAA